MVLEDSTTNPPTSDPLSDPDPYGDSQNSTLPASKLPHYHIQNVPQPNALLAAISGINTARISGSCSYHLQNASQVLHRNPTQSEAEALTQHCAAGLVTASYGKPLGYLGGLYRAYSTRKTYRFPFRTPDPQTFDPTRLTIFGTTLFEGQQSRVVWHALRCLSYGVGIGYLGHLVFGVWGMWKMTVGEATDDRLKEFIKAQREAMKNTKVAERMDRMKRAGSVDNKDAGEVLRRSGERQAQNNRQRRGVERQETTATPDWDDASPSAVGWDDMVTEPVTGEPSPSSAPSPDAYSKKRIPIQRQVNVTTKDGAQQKTDQEQYGTSADSLLSDLGAPSSDTSNGSPSSTGKRSSSESAWARIRRENASSDSDSGS